MGGLFGGGGTSTTVTSTQTAQQAAVVTVNPSTTVSLSVDTSDIADALNKIADGTLTLETAKLEQSQAQYNASLLVALSDIGVKKQDLLLTQAGLNLQAQQSVAISSLVSTIGNKFYTLIKYSALAYGLYLLISLRSK